MCYADEGAGISKYYADPDHPRAAEEIAVFGVNGWKGDREGIALFAGANGSGYVICTDRVPGNSEYRLYTRQGDQSSPIAVVRGGGDATDGIEATSASLGPRFASGLFVAMNNSGNK